MTKPEMPENGLRDAVEETVHLYKEAKNSIFKLMASVSIHTSPKTTMLYANGLQDSVPKFLRDPRYTEYLIEHGVSDAVVAQNGVGHAS